MTFFLIYAIINIDKKKGVIIIRLWHVFLFTVLPREQLVGCWREISAIASNIQTKGEPHHILVNFVNDYDYDHFISYAYYIREEMTIRKYRTMESVWNKIIALKPNWNLLPLDEVYSDKMNDFYFKVCYYNLAEKHSCGGFGKEWNLIEGRKNILYDE